MLYSCIILCTLCRDYECIRYVIQFGLTYATQRGLVGCHHIKRILIKYKLHWSANIGIDIVVKDFFWT